MTDTKHRFIYEFEGIKVEAYNTQKEIAEMLINPKIKLISVNNVRLPYYPKRKKVNRNEQ